jgi:hypothetical protein
MTKEGTPHRVRERAPALARGGRPIGAKSTWGIELDPRVSHAEI